MKAWILKELKWLAWTAIFWMWLENRRIKRQRYHRRGHD